MSLSQITGSLISMQNSLKTASRLASTKTELQSQALVYAPSFAYKGDPKKAAALTDKADGIDGSIHTLCGSVQKTLTDISNTGTDDAEKSSRTQQTQPSGTDAAQSSKDNAAVQSTDSGTPEYAGRIPAIGGYLDVKA